MVFPIWIPFENEWWTCALIFCTIIILVIGSEILYNNHLISPESNRRLVHFIVGALVAISPLIFHSNIQPLTLSFIFIIFNIIALKYEKFKGIHSQKRITYGTIYFPISYMIIIFGFWDYPEFIIISFSVFGFADPFAAQIGTNNPSFFRFIIWEDIKTYQGTIAFFSSAFFIIYTLGHFLLDYSNNYLFLFSLFVSIFATIAEITSSKGSDNLTIPIISILFMIGYFEIIPKNIDNIYDLFLNGKFILLLSIIILFIISYYLSALTISGLFGGIIMGAIIIMYGTLNHLIPLGVFFILSSILSKVLKSASFYRTKGSQRDIIQVYANGGIALSICIINYFNPNSLYIYLFLSSVAAAMSDTWATEFGKLSKIKPISIITMKPIDHGLSGGVTRIGTLGSLLGSCIIGLTAWYFIPAPSFIIYGIIFSGFSAAIFDSILGASCQAKYRTKTGDVVEVYLKESKLISGKQWINNDTVNILNTIIAPIIMYLYLLL